MSTDKNLFSVFPPVTDQEWEDKIIKDLKGKPIENLQWELNNDIKLSPFYRNSQQGHSPITQAQKTDNNWDIAEDFILTTDLKEDNSSLLTSLMGGIDAPRIFINKNLSVAEFRILFNQVNFDYISTHLRLSKEVDSSIFLKNFDNYLQSLSPSKSIHTFSGSIIGAGYQHGLSAKTIGIKRHSSAENDIPKELAQMLHLAVNTIVTLEPKTTDLKNILQSFLFIVEIDTSHFPAIAKIRALQLLWARICKGFECSYIRPEIEVEFSETAYTEDQNTNMIRATTIAMSAVIGGADRLIVRPSTHQDTTTPFARRIARNVQHLLKMESFMDKVIDPASGSYYIEKMTEVFVTKTWEEFLKLEKNIKYTQD